jgi:hypothetical protein
MGNTPDDRAFAGRDYRRDWTQIGRSKTIQSRDPIRQTFSKITCPSSKKANQEKDRSEQ